MRIDQEALAAGVFAMSEAAGLFPEGLPFDFPALELPPSPRPLQDCFDSDQDTLDLYLAVPPYRLSGLNVSMAPQQADTRYLAEVLMLRDENTGLAEKPVQVARKNYRLLAGTDARQDCSILQVARVRRTGTGSLELDPQFVPPLLDFSASEYLLAIARRLVEILTARGTTLGGMRRQKNLSLADFGATDIANFWLLYTINSHLPEIRHLFETRHGHPDRLFRAMLSLAGCLTTFSNKMQPGALPVYDHNNLSACFQQLDEIVRSLLETVIPSNCLSLPLKLVQPSIYATSLADDKYFAGARMFLAVSSELNAAELISKTPYLVKVCSASHIEHLVRQALPGLALTHMPKPPGAIPIKSNYQYFSLNQAGVVWEAVVRARNLAAYVPGDIPAPQMELVILLAEAA